MELKHYKSYDDIDKELKILQLEREIHFEKIKLGLSTLREDVKPSNIVKGFLGFTKDSDTTMMSKVAKLAMPFVLRFVRKKVKIF